MSQKRAKKERKMIKEQIDNGFVKINYNNESELHRLCGGGFISLMDRQTAEFYKKLK